ncbi:MAG: thioredoxin domain-containing protein [Candidatus Paceibacterota bacterium]|jgi:protein-disulfide isomerase
MSNKQEQSVYYVPGAILLAGFVIAGAIYFTNKDNGGAVANNKANTPAKTAPATGAAPKAISADEHILGNPNAEIKIVEYSDTECPFCKRFHVTMHSLIDTYGKDGKVAWVYRHFPLTFHKKAIKEAEATECAAEIGGNKSFWAMLDMIYSETEGNDSLDATKLPVFAKNVGLDVTKFNTCLSSGKMTSIVTDQQKDGLRIGVNGTPYTVMILTSAIKDNTVKEINDFVISNNIVDRDGKPLINVSSDKKRVTTNGALPVEAMKTVIDILLKK